MKLTHEVYKQAIGAEFGKTVLGFFGDETDYNGFIPWTPKLLEEFQKQKGYDLKPYIPLFFMGKLTDEAQRAKADYYDVWSGMFAKNFFDVEADWAAKNNMEDLRHVGASSVPLYLIRNEGDFFRDMRHVQVPGIDNLNQNRSWHRGQLPQDSLLRGAPVRKTEGLGGGGRRARGAGQVHDRLPFRARRHGPSGSRRRRRRWRRISAGESANFGHVLVCESPRIPALHRTAGGSGGAVLPHQQRLDGRRRLHHRHVSADAATYEHQIDFDYLDEQVLTTLGTLEGGGLKNLSGQVYRGIIIPSSTVITRAALDRLRAFAAQGGKVIFVGRTPTQVIERTFLKPAGGAPDLSFAVLEPAAEITVRVVQALPKPDVALDRPCPPIIYNHRSLLDGQVYYFFNDSNQRQTRTAVLAGGGQPQV